MPSRAIVVHIGIGIKVVIMVCSQITKFYSKKLNPIYLLQVLWNSNVLKEKP